MKQPLSMPAPNARFLCLGMPDAFLIPEKLLAAIGGDFPMPAGVRDRFLASVEAKARRSYSKMLEAEQRYANRTSRIRPAKTASDSAPVRLYAFELWGRCFSYQQILRYDEEPKAVRHPRGSVRNLGDRVPVILGHHNSDRLLGHATLKETSDGVSFKLTDLAIGTPADDLMTQFRGKRELAVSSMVGVVKSHTEVYERRPHDFETITVSDGCDLIHICVLDDQYEPRCATSFCSLQPKFS